MNEDTAFENYLETRYDTYYASDYPEDQFNENHETEEEED